jgi:nitrogen fixation protein NifB
MNLDNHPCFNKKACKDFGRVHLPVAPACNIQCNFCNRKFDCVNESRPGVSSSILSPEQAMAYLAEVVEAKPNTTVVGIAGPGDPFANPVQTMETLRSVRAQYPEMMLCVASNGLAIGPYVDELADLNVTHISITVNAVDPKIGEKIYAWVRNNKRTMGPERGAELLLERQLDAIAALKAKNILVKSNTIVLPGINDHHVEAIAEKMAALKVDILNCMPYFPTAGSNFEDLEEPAPKLINSLRKTARKHIPQMTHCKRCRADAVGLLDDPMSTHLMERLRYHATAPTPLPGVTVKSPAAGKTVTGEKQAPARPYVAVATREGVLVNQHLGEARTLNIYDISKSTPVMIEKRQLPKPGGKDFRWYGLANIIQDCHTLLVSGIGDTPRKVLAKEGLNILEINGMIDLVLTALKKGEELNHLIVRENTNCGECRGTGTGCM